LAGDAIPAIRYVRLGVRSRGTDPGDNTLDTGAKVAVVANAGHGV